MDCSNDCFCDCCKEKKFYASATANAEGFTNTGDKVTASASANASSCSSYEDALKIANNIATDVAYSELETDIDIIQQTIDIIGNRHLGVTGATGPTGYIYNAGSSGVYVKYNCQADSFTTLSDYRIKEDVIPLNDTFLVDNLNPVTYMNTQTSKQDIGLIAHELQQYYPELVIGEKDGAYYQSVNYTGLIPILIKEIKELKNEVKILKERK